jgi:hypothetical protein
LRCSEERGEKMDLTIDNGLTSVTVARFKIPL